MDVFFKISYLKSTLKLSAEKNINFVQNMTKYILSTHLVLKMQRNFFFFKKLFSAFTKCVRLTVLYVNRFFLIELISSLGS